MMLEAVTVDPRSGKSVIELAGAGSRIALAVQADVEGPEGFGAALRAAGDVLRAALASVEERLGSDAPRPAASPAGSGRQADQASAAKMARRLFRSDGLSTAKVA
jgi:hypothetical protein